MATCAKYSRLGRVKILGTFLKNKESNTIVNRLMA